MGDSVLGTFGTHGGAAPAVDAGAAARGAKAKVVGVIGTVVAEDRARDLVLRETPLANEVATAVAGGVPTVEAHVVERVPATDWAAGRGATDGVPLGVFTAIVAVFGGAVPAVGADVGLQMLLVLLLRLVLLLLWLLFLLLDLRRGFMVLTVHGRDGRVWVHVRVGARKEGWRAEGGRVSSGALRITEKKRRGVPQVERRPKPTGHFGRGGEGLTLVRTQ